jgi:hypothetical protein
LLYPKASGFGVKPKLWLCLFSTQVVKPILDFFYLFILAGYLSATTSAVFSYFFSIMTAGPAKFWRYLVAL